MLPFPIGEALTLSVFNKNIIPIFIYWIMSKCSAELCVNQINAPLSTQCIFIHVYVIHVWLMDLYYQRIKGQIVKYFVIMSNGVVSKLSIYTWGLPVFAKPCEKQSACLSLWGRGRSRGRGRGRGGVGGGVNTLHTADEDKLRTLFYCLAKRSPGMHLAIWTNTLPMMPCPLASPS